jgi:protein NrfD
LLKTWSDKLVANPSVAAALGWANLVLGVALGIYTGILLNTMVARPLWNSAILGPLFLVSGLSAGAAVMHIAATLLQGRSAPQGMVGGRLQRHAAAHGAAHPPKATAHSLVRYDQVFLVAELIFIGLFVANLHTSSASMPPRPG